MLNELAFRKFVRLLVLPITVVGVGCANRGNPRPPSLHLPALATEVKAARVSNRVELTWMTSDKTSDGLLLHSFITAVICREVAAPHPSGRAGPCVQLSRLTVVPGLSHAADTLPPELLADPPRRLVYRVELLNGKNRSAGMSSPAFAASGMAPPDPGPIHVSARRGGAVIEWAASSSMAAVELTRVCTSTGQLAAGKKTNAGLPGAKAESSNASTVLRAAPGSGSDPGGMLDASAVLHNTYVYVAQRVRSVQVDGQTLELRSATSPSATFEFHDTFPPAAPSGLESIASLPVSGAASIDLSWDASSEPDILGYNAYRSEGSDFTLLNQTPVASPSFRDLTAQLGHSYRYRVTAVDHAGNESPASVEIKDSLPPQP